MSLSGFKTLLQFFPHLQAPDSFHTGKHKTSSASHQFPLFLSSAESHINTSHGQHSWLLCLDRPSWESKESMWCTKDVEMCLQSDFPWDPALTIVLGFAGLRLQEQENKSKGKMLPEQLWKTVAKTTWVILQSCKWKAGYWTANRRSFALCRVRPSRQWATEISVIPIVSSFICCMSTVRVLILLLKLIVI